MDLTPAVLERILPNEGASLACDRLVFDNAQAGDFELIALRDFSYGGVAYEANVELAGAEEMVADAPVPESMDPFTLAEPANVYMRVVPVERAPRDSYSYSSVSAELHEEAEDHPEPAEAPIAEAAGETAVSDGVEAPHDERAVPSHEGDPTALGSAFHAACQWLIELDRADLPVERADALCCYWGCTAEQRERFDEAMARWLSSDVRAEALAWPCVRAEVPFYSLGMDGLVERFGAYAEGAIDPLCTDPADSGRALLIDYKTGGSPDETPDQLQEKHALQANVYADVLHKAGYERVTLKFVRVEVPDPVDPVQPQVVTYEI